MIKIKFNFVIKWKYLIFLFFEYVVIGVNFEINLKM